MMKVATTGIAGAVVAESTPFSDSRGAFVRLFCNRELGSILGERKIVQINHSRTTSVGAIRGLHYQYPPHDEMKLVRCLRGRVWDVVVDLRQNSPTFLQWHGEELTPDNSRMLVIPEGCAHGFQVLEKDSELLYLHTAYYEPSAEGGVRYDDPRIAVQWPLTATEISVRDQNHSFLVPEYSGIVL